MAPRLLDETIDLAQPQASTVSAIFGGEEGFEGAARDLLAHSITGVTYAKKDILPGRHLVIVAAVVAVQEGVEGFDGKLSAAGHRISGVDCQIDNRRFELRVIDVHGPKPSGADGLDLYAFTQGALNELNDVGDESVHIERFWIERLAPREGEQSLSAPPRVEPRGLH